MTSTLPLANEEGQPFTYGMLRSRFDKARENVGISFSGFQFRDLSAKAGIDKTEAEDVRAAQGQLGHPGVTKTEIYVRIRRRDGVISG